MGDFVRRAGRVGSCLVLVVGLGGSSLAWGQEGWDEVWDGEPWAELRAALAHETVGAGLGDEPDPSPAVTPPASHALSLSGHLDLGGFVFRGGAPLLHEDGGGAGFNIALGRHALRSLTVGVPISFSGKYNTAVGASALRSATSALGNTAIGTDALRATTTGDANTALGEKALRSNLTGFGNTAIGSFALHNATTSGNTAVGFEALRLAAGVSNTAVGYHAGSSLQGGSHNVFIASRGETYDTRTLRIGDSTGGDSHRSLHRAFIHGIRGVTTGQANAIPVHIDAAGQLGTVSSSERVKEDIRDLGEVSDRLYRLRPVAFKYRQAFTDGSKPERYGLVAEEVAEVFPDLVSYAAEGIPEAVLADLLDAMVLNELQEHERTIAEQRAALAKQGAELAELRARLARLEAARPAASGRAGAL